jgi:SAM-dependent methyltransferase
VNEIEEIEKRYKRRKNSHAGEKAARYSALIVEEREKIYGNILTREFTDLRDKRMIEIGAGSGANIPFFLGAGFAASNIEANELLSDRVHSFKGNFPEIRLHEGNALDLDENNKYDLVFQSTVFSSILDDNFRAELAQKLLRLLKPSGFILSYDFVYNNPSNPDVKKFTKEDIERNFPDCTYEFFKVTLAPPVGRRVPALYKFLNTAFPFLRTHMITVIKKK